MRLISSSMAHFQITSADVSGALRRLTDRGIDLHEVQILDELTACFYVAGKDHKEARYCLEEQGVHVKLLNQQSAASVSIRSRCRPVLILGVLLICIASLFLSQRILFIRIEGNDEIPALQIKEVAASCGIKLGARSRDVRSEKIKNQLLEAIPQLQWAGVNTQGCVAVIRIEEKAVTDELQPQIQTVTSIVASKDGVIDSLTVTSGNSLCYVGQAVKEGQTLISGYTDCGIVIKAQQAEGEIFAKTRHKITAITPLHCLKREDKVKTTVSYSLKIGKKLINFDKGSGISPGTCVKMYEERYLTLPGGFRLPISLVRQTTVSYETDAVSVTVNQKQNEKAVEEYLLSQLVAGQILQSDVEATDNSDHIVLTGQYLCSEMIGRTKIEESVQGETNRD